MEKIEQIILSNYRKNIFQYHGINPTPCYGEDGVFEKIFEVVGLPKVPQVIEFGEHRVLGTTSRLLRIRFNSRALYFASDYNFNSLFLNIRDLINLAMKYRILKFNYILNMPRRIKADKENIVNLICDFFVNREIDMAVIDIDSNDYELIENILKQKIFPRVLVVEYNPSLGNEDIFMSENSLPKKNAS